jgi:hypothetical protein
MRKLGGQDYIEYKNGYPNFDPWRARHNGQMIRVEIEMSGNYGPDGTRARAALAATYKLTSQQVAALEKNNIWHHAPNVVIRNGKIYGEMHLVAKKIHNTFKHSGGAELWRFARRQLGQSPVGYD